MNRPGFPGGAKLALLLLAGMAGMGLLALVIVPMGIIGGGSLLFAAGGGCPGASASPAAGQGGRGNAGTGNASTGAGGAIQPAASTTGRDSIPANYLALYQQIGRQYGVPWVLLAGIGEVETNDGRSALPGVHSGQNGFGAAGPMQIGIGGAAGDTWGGTPVHPAGEHVNGVATDANGDGVASVYEPADAIAGAAKYLLNHGVLDNVSGAIFAYNHLESYVQDVLYWAGLYASGGYTLTSSVSGASPGCVTGVSTGQVPNQAIATVISYARAQIGKPYLWGGIGPDAFDCSGLVMMAYRAAGIDIPRTSQAQWTWGPRIPAGHEQPGDLVFFAGSDGTRASPGHVGLVIGGGLMIEAYATGFPVRIAPYTDRGPVGFTRPWSHSGLNPGPPGT